MILVPEGYERRGPSGLILPDRRIITPPRRCPYERPRPRRRPDMGLAVAFDSAANTGTGDNKTCNRPGTSTANRIMVALVSAYDSTTHTITPPAGWTSIRATTFSGGGGSGKVESFWKLDTGSEGASYTWTISSGNYTNIAIGAWTGCDTSTPVDTSSGNSGTASPATGTGVTAARNSSALIAFYVGYNLTSWATPTGMTSRSSWDGACAMFDESVNAGATGNRTSTHTTNVWASQLIVLQPPAAGGGTDTTRFFFAS